MKKIIVIIVGMLSGLTTFSQSLEIAKYPVQKVGMRNVRLTDNFWLPKIRQIQQVTIPVAFAKCEETGIFENFLIAEKVIKGGTGKVNGKMPFDDTDPYKIIEGASLTLMSAPNAKLDALLNKYISIIARGQEPDGYLTTWRTINPVAPPAKWVGDCKKRWDNESMSHELYNAGHLYEAAATHFYATGKRNFLNIALKNADLVVKVFSDPNNYDVPGHEIIETGLIKLYLITGKKKYFDMAKKFVDLRGTSEHRKPRGEYWQDYKPLFEQDEAVGHAVRAVYYYAGVTDVAAISGDERYKKTIKNIWNNMVNRKMYVTGGLGAKHNGEAFGKNYELPNLTAYNETCAAIGGVMWADRMFRLFGGADYYNILERILYNGLLSGVSLDGKCFFYPNPLESDGVYKFNQGNLTRAGWFECPCCPTNMIRFLPSVSNLIYDVDKEGIFVNLFIANEAKIPFGKTNINLTQTSNYPLDGNVKIAVNPESKLIFTIKIRIPDWATNAFPSELYGYQNSIATSVKLLVNNQKVDYKVEGGYIKIHRNWQRGDKIDLNIPMEVRNITANPLIEDDKGKTSIQYGPLMYCLEKIDNSDSYDGNFDAKSFKINYNPNKLGGINEIIAKDAQKEWNFIPYYSWSNRGVGEMKVWVKESK